MKVILSVDAIHYPLTGIGRYTLELGSRLDKYPQISEVKFCKGSHVISHIPEYKKPPSLREKFWIDSKKFLKKSKIIESIYRKTVGTRTPPSPSDVGDTNEVLFHGTNFQIPQFAGPTAVTIHDLSIIKYPQFHPEERTRHLTREIEKSVNNASMIITDSLFVNKEIRSHFNLKPDRVRTAHLASSPGFRPRDADTLQPVLKTYGLRAQEYCLYTGTIEPRKNLEGLMVAYARLPVEQRRAIPLVLCGSKGWNNARTLEAVQRGKRDGWIKHLEFVPEADLQILMSGARLFLFPSFYEGFGLPVLEAMASGTAVICSSEASLPEITGDAGATTAANDLDGLADLIQMGIEDDHWRQTASARGLEQASKFSWARCAVETVKIYQEAIELA